MSWNPAQSRQYHTIKTAFQRIDIFYLFLENIDIKTPFLITYQGSNIANSFLSPQVKALYEMLTLDNIVDIDRKINMSIRVFTEFEPQVWICLWHIIIVKWSFPIPGLFNTKLLYCKVRIQDNAYLFHFFTLHFSIVFQFVFYLIIFLARRNRYIYKQSKSGGSALQKLVKSLNKLPSSHYNADTHQCSYDHLVIAQRLYSRQIDLNQQADLEIMKKSKIRFNPSAISEKNCISGSSSTVLDFNALSYPQILKIFSPIIAIQQLRYLFSFNIWIYNHCPLYYLNLENQQEIQMPISNQFMLQAVIKHPTKSLEKIERNIKIKRVIALNNIKLMIIYIEEEQILSEKIIWVSQHQKYSNSQNHPQNWIIQPSTQTSYQTSLEKYPFNFANLFTLQSTHGNPVIVGDYIYFPNSDNDIESLGSLRMKVMFCQTEKITVLAKSVNDSQERPFMQPMEQEKWERQKLFFSFFTSFAVLYFRIKLLHYGQQKQTYAQDVLNFGELVVSLLIWLEIFLFVVQWFGSFLAMNVKI